VRGPWAFGADYCHASNEPAESSGSLQGSYLSGAAAMAWAISVSQMTALW
jgi:hypothetical protein